MSTTPQERIAARLKERRQSLGLSQETVAHRIGTTMRTYARWERVESFGFLQRLDEIAEALETTESDLLGGEDPLSSQPAVEDLAAKLDDVKTELQELREDLKPLIEEQALLKKRDSRRR